MSLAPFAGKIMKVVNIPGLKLIGFDTGKSIDTYTLW